MKCSSLMNNNVDPEFQPGQIVFVKSDPAIRGAIVSVAPGKPENRFKLFINGATQTFYASQLQAEDMREEKETRIACDQFHAYLTALQIKHPGLSTLYSLNAARVDFIPYQFRPVLRFIRSDRHRLLIADDVGVGKTIEAGLILRELQARREMQSVLIVCPRPLITEKKWQNEMKRFEERFTHLDGAALRYCINEMDLEGVWPNNTKKPLSHTPCSMRCSFTARFPVATVSAERVCWISIRHRVLIWSLSMRRTTSGSRIHSATKPLNSFAITQMR